MVFYFSKILAFFLSPINILFLLTIFFWVSDFFEKTKFFTEPIKKIIIFFWLFLTYESLPHFYLSQLESQYSQYGGNYSEINAIAILGGGTGFGVIAEQRNETNLGEAAERITESTKAFNINPELKIIILGAGGSLSENGFSEYEITERFLIEQGVPSESIIIEKKSRNTYENIKYLREIMTQNKIHQIGIITSAYHMPRTMKLTNKWLKDKDIIPIPVDYKSEIEIDWLEFSLRASIQKWDILLHEIVGSLFYEITDRT